MRSHEDLRWRVVGSHPDVPRSTTIRYERVTVSDLITVLNGLGYEVVVIDEEE